MSEAAKKKQLIQYDPLTGKYEEIVEKLLDLEDDPLAPKGVLSHRSLPTATIEKYRDEQRKRIIYHLERGNNQMVKYFMDELRKLNDQLYD